MMKKSIFTMAMAGIMAFSGSSMVMARSAPIMPDGNSQEIETTTETATETKEGDFTAEIIDDMEIVTPYYTITTPVRWMGAYNIETVDNETGMWLHINFKADKEKGGGGHLFSVLMTDDDKYKIMPSYDYLGELEDKEGHVYSVLGVYPTDVQFTKENKDNYMAMYNEKDGVLDTLKAADGCTFKGRTGITVDYGESELFNEGDMNTAVKLIREEFASWRGCEMHSIRYTSDDFNNEENLKWVNDLREGKNYVDCMEFLTDFHSPVEEKYLKDTAWEADKEYKDYEWILARSKHGPWELISWGY